METTLQELNARALATVARLDRIQSPLVGIPLVAGAPPFVTRRDYLEGQTKGIRNLRLEFQFPEHKDARPCLVIRGEFGKSGKHFARLYSHRGLPEHARLMCWNWATKQREGLAKRGPVVEVVSDAEVVSKAQARLESKIRQLDAEIVKQEKRAAKLGDRRPVNPLIGRRSQWDSDLDNADTWERRRAAKYYAEKAKRQLVSRLAAKYLPQCTARVGKYGKISTRFPWAEFYAELGEHGIRVTYQYVKCHNWKDGPKTIEDYLRNVKWFGLVQGKMHAGIYKRDSWAEQMQGHAMARREYADVLKERASYQSVIEGLKVQREEYQEQVEAIRRAEGAVIE